MTKSSRWWELCSRVSGHPGARLQMSAVLLLAIPGLVGSAPHMALASLQFGRPPWHAARPMTPIMQLGNPLANFFGKKEEASKKKKESATGRRRARRSAAELASASSESDGRARALRMQRRELQGTVWARPAE